MSVLDPSDPTNPTDPPDPSTSPRTLRTPLRSIGVLGRGLLCALALAGASSAQGAPQYWEGLVHDPLGAAALSVNGGSKLVVGNIGSSGLDGVESRLPRSSSSGVTPAREIDLAPIDPVGSLPTGAELRFVSKGTLGGLPGVDVGELRATKLASGRVEYMADFSSLGATSYTFELWDGSVLLGTLTGVTADPGYPGPLFRPNCDTHPLCCWLGQVTYVNGHWVATWPCLQLLDLNQSQYTARTVVITPENPTLAPDELTSCVMLARDIPAIELTGQILTGFESIGGNFCSAVPNSTGMAGVITATGTNEVSSNDLDILAFQLPNDSFGYFIVSPFQAFVPNAGGSQGNLCVGLSTGRFMAQIGNTGSQGYLTANVDLTSLPQPNGSVAVSAGQTWNFQCWHRDANPTVTSNFTDAYSVLFR